jgi:hypothetical protein
MCAVLEEVAGKDLVKETNFTLVYGVRYLNFYLF